MEIEDYPNYLIYEDGRVWSKIGKGRFLKPIIRNKKRGYTMVRLSNKNVGKILSLHRLVAIHYIPNPENKPFVDHINHIVDDNRVENLRWATISENTLNTDKVKPKTGFTYIYEREYSWIIRIFKLGYVKRYSKSKYTIEEVVLIRDMILN
jgi:hypothetical protein